MKHHVGETVDNHSSQVLVVDDCKQTRQIIIKMISPLGVNSTEAGNGEEALDVLKKQRVDVVISDLVMPKMSGILLLHSMLEQGYQIPFILVSGYSDKDSAIQALRLGAFDYLEKPVDETDLQTVLKEAIRVSCEQRKLIEMMRNHKPDLENTPAFRENAELQIMKMRTFRYENEDHDLPDLKDKTRSWQELRDLFVQEVEPQLIFCAGALKSLELDPASLKNLGFMLRVIQSVRMASESLRLNDIAELSWSYETCLAGLRQQPGSLSKDMLELLIRANESLTRKVSLLCDSSFLSVQKELDHLNEKIKFSTPGASLAKVSGDS